MEILIIQNLNYFTIFLIPVFLLFFLIIFNKKVLNRNLVLSTHFFIFFFVLLIFVENNDTNIFIYLFTFQIIYIYIYIRNAKITSFKIIRMYFLIAISIIFSLQISTNLHNNLESTKINRNYKVFFTSQDNFADTIKLSVSFDFLFDRNEIKDINGINKKFYLDNEYFLENIALNCENNKLIPQCNNGIYKNTPRHYGLPPLYLSTIVIFGFLLKFFNNVYLLLAFLTFTFSFLAYLILKKYFYNKRFLYIFIMISSFPFLLAIQRGNFISIIVLIMLMKIFYKKYFRESFNIFDLLLLALIINFRPNMILIVPLFIYKNSIILFFKNCLKLGILILFVFFLCLNFLTLLIYNYSLDVFVNNFLLYADELINQYVSYGGNGYNSSFFAFAILLKNNFSELLFNLGLNINFLNRVMINNFVVVILISICLYTFYLYKENKINFEESFTILLISSLIISPSIGDYYLTLLLVPLFLYLNKNEINRKQLMIQFFIFFVMLPKPHSFIEPVYGVSLGLFFNFLSLSFIIYLILFEKNYDTNFKRK